MTNDGKYANTGGLKKLLEYLRNLFDNKADKATTLEGYGITDAFKYKGQVNGESVDSNLWSDYGVKGYDNVLPDGMEDAYPYGVLVSFADADKTFQFFSSEDSAGNGGIKWRSGKDDDKGEWHDIATLDLPQAFKEKQTFEKGFEVGSNELIANLNADLLDGYEASDFATKDDISDLDSIIASIEQQIAGKMDKVTLATVATSGSYNDLSNKPTIPSAVTESTVSGWGFTKNTGTVTGVKINGSTKYPSSGIVDLGTVIDSGGSMDNDELSEFVGRLIGYGEGEDGVFSDGYYYDGGGDSVVATIEAMDTNIHNALMGKANASTTLDGYGITDKLFKSLGTQANIADTKGWGVFQYNSTTAGAPSNYGSIIQWVNPTNYDSKPSVNGWYTQLFSATDNGGLSYRTATNGYGWKSWVKLVDSSNIGSHLKTINGQSIVGSGDITIEGGSGGGSCSPAYPVVNHDASDNTLYLTPNTLHIWDEVGTLDLSLGDETAGVANEYLFEFKSGAEATTLSLPNDIKFTEDLVIEANKIYQVSILNNLASVLSWENAPSLIDNHITYNEGSMMSGATITFEYPTASELTFMMNNYESSYLIIPVGTTSITIDWFEPAAPIIKTISPMQDGTYNYIY